MRLGATEVTKAYLGAGEVYSASVGAVPASLVFPGTRHLLTAGYTPARTLREVTFTAWIKPTGTIARNGIFAMQETVPTIASRFFAAGTHPAVNYQVLGAMADDAGATQNYNANRAGLVTLYDVWTFVAIRVNSAGLGQVRYNAEAWANLASMPDPYSVLNIVSQAVMRIGCEQPSLHLMRSGGKIFQPTISFRGLSDADVTTIYNKDLSPADLSWDTTDAFDGTTLVCSDPTFNAITTGTGSAITFDTGDVP